VTNAAGATWAAPNLAVYGELVKKGTLTFPNSIVFGDGATFVADALPADGVVLTSKTIVTNGTLSVAVAGDSAAYVASIVGNGDGTASLVFTKAPLPEMVPIYEHEHDGHRHARAVRTEHALRRKLVAELRGFPLARGIHVRAVRTARCRRRTKATSRRFRAFC
jgi:hypothetical protein